MTDFATLDSTIGDIELTPAILAQGFGQCNGRDGMPLDARHLNAVLKLFCACLIKPGMIQIWHFETGPIPTGWVICDGENGTPNFTDHFIVGAGADYNPGVTGGANIKDTIAAGNHNHDGKTAEHTLTIAQIPAHDHEITDPGHEHGHGDETSEGAAPVNLDGDPPNLATGSTALPKTTSSAVTGISINEAGSGEAHDHGIANSGTHTHEVDVRPQYYAAIWIMKT